MGSPAIHPIGAFVQGPNPFQDIINGMVTGVQLHGELQRARDEHTAMLQNQIQQARQNRIQDITQKMLLQQNSRQVDPNGTVTEQGNPLTYDLGNGVSGSTPVSITRKADKSRVVSYRDQDGNEMQRELLSPMEQIQRQVTQDQAIARGQGKLMDVDPNSTLGRWLGLSAPQTVPTTALPQLYRPMVSEENNQRTNDTRVTTNAATNDTRANVADQTNQTRVGIADANRTAANDRADNSNQTRKDVAAMRGGRGGALTPNAEGVQARFQQRQQAADQKTVDSLQQQEQKLHGQRQALGDAISAKDGDTVPDPLNPSKKVAVNAAYRSLWKTRLDQATAQVAGLQQTQTRLIKRWGGSAGAKAPGTGDGQPADAQTPAAIPDAAKQKLKKGVITTFGNGQRWTLDATGTPQQVQAAGS